MIFIALSCICLALVGRPSLHSYDACMFFFGFKGHPGDIAGKNKVRPLFLLIRFFLFSRKFNGAVLGSGSLVFMDRGLRILGLALPVILHLRSSMSVVGLLMVILP